MTESQDPSEEGRGERSERERDRQIEREFEDLEEDEPPHLQHGSPHPDEPDPYDEPNPQVP